MFHRRETVADAPVEAVERRLDVPEPGAVGEVETDRDEDIPRTEME